MADKRGREWGDSSSETETESDSDDTHSRNKDQKQTKKKKKYKTRYSKEWEKTTKMMSKCRKCHLRETKFAKFPGGACPQTPLEARAVGARLSAFGANRASLFLLKRGWNVCIKSPVYTPKRVKTDLILRITSLP